MESQRSFIPEMLYRNSLGQLQTKEVVEFGEEKTVYRVLTADGWSTLWHSTSERAISAWERHADNAATAAER